MKTKEIKTTALIGAAVIVTALVGVKATSTVKERENNINKAKTSIMKTESQNQGQVYEVALLSVKGDVNDNFSELNKEALDYLSTFEGYISSETYQSISESNVYLDIVLWDLWKMQ